MCSSFDLEPYDINMTLAVCVQVTVRTLSSSHRDSLSPALMPICYINHFQSHRTFERLRVDTVGVTAGATVNLTVTQRTRVNDL